MFMSARFRSAIVDAVVKKREREGRNRRSGE